MSHDGYAQYQGPPGNYGPGGFQPPYPPQYPPMVQNNSYQNQHPGQHPVHHPIQHQPGPNEKMSIQNAGANARNALNKPRGTGGKRDWSHGLFDCCGDCGSCICASCCSCCLYGKSRSKFDALETSGPTDGGYCNGSCCCFFLWSFIGCQCIALSSEREALQRRYNIDGGGCGNCLLSCCCQCCVQVQHMREIKEEEYFIRGGH